jgi:hypothetical protein
MNTDAGRAAFEELKQRSKALVEFVAADQGVHPEIVFRVLLGVGNAVRLSAGQAAAAVLLDKPAEQVTKTEVLRAIRGIAGRGDNDDRFQRARRAALRETFFLLAPVGVPDNLAGLVIKSGRRLDEGSERAGMFTPAKRSRGRPGRSANDADERLMIEVAYTRTFKNVSLDEAVTLATGVRRADAATTRHQLPEAAMPRHGDHRALRRVVTELMKAKPDVADRARMAAEARLRGEPNQDFEAFREGYLAIERAMATRRGGAASTSRNNCL